MITTGVLEPTVAASMPTVAVKAYAGATEGDPEHGATEQNDDVAFQALVSHLNVPSRVSE